MDSRVPRRAPLVVAALLASGLVMGCPAVAPTAPPPSSGELRYVALGDSFTIGTGIGPPRAFPARLSERWRRQGLRVTLTNLATNGFTASEVLQDQVPHLCRLAPARVTLGVGANDLVRGHDEDEYRRDLVRLLDAVLAALAAGGLPPARLAVLPQPDWSRSPAARAFGSPAGIGARIVRFNAILREEATRRGARFVDLWPLMRAHAERGELAGDGLHPSAAAHEAWAAALEQAWSR
jgi:lysophospholipase L1-like esterase